MLPLVSANNVLVAVVPSRRDWNLVRTEGWYRIPGRTEEPLSAILFGAEVVAPYKRGPVKVETRTLQRYVGKWTTVIAEEPWNFGITVHDGRICRRIDDSPEMEVLPESATKFYYSDCQDKVFEFLPDDKGNITEAWFIMNGLKYPLHKAASVNEPPG